MSKQIVIRGKLVDADADKIVVIKMRTYARITSDADFGDTFDQALNKKLNIASGNNGKP